MKVTHQSLANQTIPAERKRRKIRDSLACSFPRAVESNRPLKTKKRTKNKKRERDGEEQKEKEKEKEIQENEKEEENKENEKERETVGEESAKKIKDK